MLLLDPENRVTAAEALSLPYFSIFREPDEETEALPYDHSLDNAELTVDQWKRKDRFKCPRVISMWICFEMNAFVFFRSYFYRNLDFQTHFSGF